jgi:ribonuclease J
MVTIIGIAQELGCIHIPKGTLIDIEELKNYPENKTVIITTGSQGESMAALSRMASGMHRKVSVHKGDIVVMSSTPVPGNEKAVYNVINELTQKGAKVIFQDTHVSGHACKEDLKLLYSLLKPKYAIPVHGEYRHLQAQQMIAMEMGIPEKNTVLMHSGDVLEMTGNSMKITGKVQAGSILVDGLGVGDVGNIVLRDRQNLSQHGIMIVVLTLDRASCTVIAGPNIVSRGVIYVRESENLMEEAQGVVEEAVDRCLERKNLDRNKLKTEIRDALGDFLWKKMKRDPVILPIIMEV